MEFIYHKKILIAIKISSIKRGSLPVTDGTQPLQLVTLKHPKGTYLKAHLHKPKKRITQTLQECLIVKKGRVKIDLYTSEKVYIKSVFLNAGQTLLLSQGGYGIHLMQDSELIELKNGPFIEDKELI